MNRIHKMFLLLAIFFVAVSSLSAATFTVNEVEGKVNFRGAKSFKKEIIEKGDELAPGGRISMKDGESIELETPMGDIIKLKDKTYLRLSKLEGDEKKSTLQLDLFQGKTDSSVHKLQGESSYTIKTPVAVVGVRGTDFRCNVDEAGTTEVQVLTGEVGVQDVDGQFEPTPVPAGSAAKVSSDGKVKVKVSAALKREGSKRKAAVKKRQEKKEAAKKEAVKKAADPKAAASKAGTDPAAAPATKTQPATGEGEPATAEPAPATGEGEAEPTEGEGEPAEPEADEPETDEPETDEPEVEEEEQSFDEIEDESDDLSDQTSEAVSQEVEDAVNEAIEEITTAIDDELEQQRDEEEAAREIDLELTIESINR